MRTSLLPQSRSQVKFGRKAAVVLQCQSAVKLDIQQACGGGGGGGLRLMYITVTSYHHGIPTHQQLNFLFDNLFRLTREENIKVQHYRAYVWGESIVTVANGQLCGKVNKLWHHPRTLRSAGTDAVFDPVSHCLVVSASQVIDDGHWVVVRSFLVNLQRPVTFQGSLPITWTLTLISPIIKCGMKLLTIPKL